MPAGISVFDGNSIHFRPPFFLERQKACFALTHYACSESSRLRHGSARNTALGWLGTRDDYAKMTSLSSPSSPALRDLHTQDATAASQQANGCLQVVFIESPQCGDCVKSFPSIKGM